MADNNFTKLLISTALISRRVAVDEGMGPVNDSGDYLPVMVGFPPTQLSTRCRVAQQSARARFRAKTDGKDADVAMLTIFTEYRTDILNRDRFTVDGVNYEASDVNDPGLMHHHLEFVCKRIT